MRLCSAFELLLSSRFKLHYKVLCILCDHAPCIEKYSKMAQNSSVTVFQHSKFDNSCNVFFVTRECCRVISEST